MAVPTWALMAVILLVVAVALVAGLAAWLFARRGKRPRGFEVVAKREEGEPGAAEDSV